MLRAACLEDFEKYNKHNLNIFINRVKAYNPNGRNQTEGEAKEIDGKTSKFLEDNEVPYVMVDGNEYGYEQAVKIIRDRLMSDYKKNHPLFAE
jgi:nicotinamide riboside kinase